MNATADIIFVGVLDVGFDAVVNGDFGILAFCEPTPKET